MGLLDSIQSMAREGMANQQGGEPGAGANAQVAGGLMQALDEHPGGLAAVLEHFKNNGMEQQVQGWANGSQTTATPEQVNQGLAGSGLVESVAAKAGVSPQVAEMAMAAILPLVISHFTQGGQAAPPQSGFGGMASQILGRFL